MKKTLAIVLALVMVLCMIPAMSAVVTETKTITDKSYAIAAASKGPTVSGKAAYNTATNANSIELKYDFEDEKVDATGRFTEDTKMAEIMVTGFDGDFTSNAAVTIDGKKLDNAFAGNTAGGVVVFPVELTKAGYSDTFLIQVTETKDGKTMTETAKISVKLVNTAAYKDAKTAYITDIGASDNTIDAYIVGSKIYLDFVNSKAAVGTGYSTTTVKFTFADENKAAFTGITYVADNAVFDLTGVDETKLDKSAASFTINKANIDNGSKVTFELETKSAFYKTKEYTVVSRFEIKEADPKGIYFAETTKTIAMGEEYTPVVMGVATGKKVDATIDVTKAVDKQVLDNVDYNTIIGTREGVAYITASYSTKGNKQTYTASSMKIVVTLPGESVPPVEPAATIYYVTCRNLNVRKGAGTSYAKAGMIHRGDAVEVVEIKGGWAKLANGTYVCAKYIAK